MNKNIIIAGGRNFTGSLLLENEMHKILAFGKKYGYEFTVISGNAKGADSLGIRFAERNNLPFRIFAPDWQKYNRSAGIVRNIEMANVADFCLCFWDGKSPGTNHMRKICKQKNILLKTVYYVE
jgi:hypothetical protein